MSKLQTRRVADAERRPDGLVAGARVLRSPGLDDRRTTIVLALERCIREKGYAHSSLADIAAAAGMTASHVLYYFSGREAVLERFLQLSGDAILRDMLALVGQPAAAQIDAVTHYFFGGQIAGPVEQGIILELYGQAVHRPKLRAIKADLDRRFKDYLVGLFRQTRRRDGLSAEDAAERAHAVLTGFVTTTYFDDRLALDRTRALARDGLRELAGIDGVPPPRARAARAVGARARTSKRKAR